MYFSCIILFAGSLTNYFTGRLAASGADIIINGFGEKDEINELCKSIANDNGVRCIFAAANLREPAEIESMMSFITEKTSRPLSILVNNAGIQHVSPIESFPVNSWDAVIEINLSSVFHTTRLALPAMKSQNWGRVINVGRYN